MKTNVEKYEFQFYLEGIRLNFVNININIGAAGAEAAIEIPSTKYLSGLEPRTLGHVFYKGHGDADWKLLFEGELHGYNFSRSHNFNSATLMFRDMSAYFEAMYTYMYEFWDLLETDYKILRHFGAPFDPIKIITRSVKASRKDKVISRAGSMIDMISGLIEEIYKVNPFFSAIRDNLKFESRYHSIRDDELSDILSIEIAKTILTRSKFQSLSTIKSMINTIFSMFFYETSVVASPAYSNSTLKQIIFKPDNFFIPAPLCNIIFPNMVSGFSMSRNFMTEPTRLMLPSKTGILNEDTGNSSAKYMAYSPQELEDQGTNAVQHGYIIMSEDHKGIIPVIGELKSAIQLHGMNFKNPKDAQSSVRWAQLKYAADYMLIDKQIQGRTLSTNQCMFNPGLVVNFPGVIISNPYIYMGTINGVHHSISSQGSINTTVSMTHCRTASLYLDDIESAGVIASRKYGTNFDWDSGEMTYEQNLLASYLGEQESSYPSWLNSQYKPSSVDDTYEELFGCKSIMSINGSPNTTGQTENIRTLNETYAKYEKRKAGYIYTSKKTERNIVTKKQLLETFLGQTRISEDTYAASDVFNTYRREPVNKHLKSLEGKVGIIP